MRPHRHIRRLHAPLMIVLLMSVLIPPAEADALVLVSATRKGTVVEVTGSAAMNDGPLVQVLQDPTGDLGQLAPVHNQVAGDLIGVSLATQFDHDLVVRWSLASLSADPNGRPSVFRFRFRAGGSNYEVAVARQERGTSGVTVPNGDGWLIRCGPTRCSWAPAGTEATTLITRDADVTKNSIADFVQVVVPAQALEEVLAPGATIGPYTGAPTMEASTGSGQLELSNDADAAEMTSTYGYGLTVLLGTAGPGVDPASVEYSTPATVAVDRSGFTGSLEVPAGQAVFARACLGSSSNCAYGQSEAL